MEKKMYNLQQKQGEAEWEPERVILWSGREELKDSGDGGGGVCVWGGGGGDRGWSFEMCIGVFEGGGWGREKHTRIEWAPPSLVAARARSQIEGDQLHHQFFFFSFACGHIDSSQAVGSDMTAGYVWAWLPGWSPPTHGGGRGGWRDAGESKVGENSASAFSFPQGKHPRSHLPN